MSIRHEDKQFIESLSILGALLGTCIGAFVVMHLSDRAHRLYARETEYHQTQAALVKLSAASITPNNPIASKEVLDQLQQQIKSDKLQASGMEKSFWLRLPPLGLWGLCGLGGFTGAAAGFASVWMTGWLGSMFIYRFLRLFYMIIRKTAPNCAAAKSMEVCSQKEGASYFVRDDKRLLPMVVKLFFFMLLSLALLTLVVWRLTNL